MTPLSIRTMDGVRGGKSTRWQLVNIDTGGYQACACSSDYLGIE
jgi:hypothetical protein